jgi:ABC transporter
VTAVTGGRMTLGTLLVVLAYLSSLYGPIRALARLARTLARGAASRERILEVLDSGEVVPEATDPVPAGRPRCGLALRGAWFAYTEGAPVPRHLDLEVAAGERVCVVGPTGAGKSTLLALLQRFYDPDAGAIELDGVDLRDLELGSLRRQLALVPQDPWMLDGTIKDNIEFGKPGASAEELAAAATLAGLDEVIERLPPAPARLAAVDGPPSRSAGNRPARPSTCSPWERCCSSWPPAPGPSTRPTAAPPSAAAPADRPVAPREQPDPRGAGRRRPGHRRPAGPRPGRPPRPRPPRRWPCWPKPCRPTPTRRTGCAPTGPPGASPAGQPPPWSVPRRFHDLRRHCRWHTGQMPLVRMVATGKTSGRAGNRSRSRPSWGPGGPRAGVLRSPGAGLPRGP